MILPSTLTLTLLLPNVHAPLKVCLLIRVFLHTMNLGCPHLLKLMGARLRSLNLSIKRYSHALLCFSSNFFSLLVLYKGLSDEYISKCEGYYQGPPPPPVVMAPPQPQYPYVAPPPPQPPYPRTNLGFLEGW